MIYSRITGTGSFLPGEKISNQELIEARNLESSDQWIIERTGIRSRHFSPPGITSSDLALEASQRALVAAGRKANDVDLIVVATSTPDFVFPSTAALLQNKLGINNGSPAFDVQAVCSGFSYALVIADKFIRSGSHRCALVIGAEVFSRLLDWTDRKTCVLFGDGAGAIVLEAATEPGLLASVLHADGSNNGILSVPGQIYNGVPMGDPFLRMDGQAVFKLAVRVLADAAMEVLDVAEMSVEQVDWLIPHQANVRILQMVTKRLGVPVEKCISTVDHHGNTSAASIPLALDESVKSGQIRRDQNLVIAGVGGGFTWGATVLRF